MSSTRVPYACNYCKELVSDAWRKHRKSCKKFKKAYRRGLAKKEGNPWANPSWTIAFRSHKTYRGKGLPVVVDNLIHDLLVAWIRRRHPDDSGETQLFRGVRWETMLTMLGRIVSPKVLKGAEGRGPIGSKAMRQFCSTMILKKSKKPHDAMRRIGTYLRRMYLFVLLDLFIPVLRNCRSFQVVRRKWLFVTTPRTARKTPIRSKFSLVGSRLFLNRTQQSQFHFQTSLQAGGEKNAAGGQLIHIKLRWKQQQQHNHQFFRG